MIVTIYRVLNDQWVGDLYQDNNVSGNSHTMTSSNGNVYRVTGHLCGKFTVPRWIPRRPVTRSFDVFFDLRLNKRLSKQSWGWWFKTLSRPLWLHCNDGNSSYDFDILQWSDWRMTFCMDGCSITVTLHGRHSDSNHQRLGCLFNTLHRLTTKKTSKLHT